MKQHQLGIFSELKEKVVTDPNFLSNIIMDDDSWVYTYDPKTKQHPTQWKSMVSPDCKMPSR